MIKLSQSLIALPLAALVMSAAPVPAMADGHGAQASAAAQASAFEADRADILAMAGNFKVTFDMKETTPWHPEYTPIDAKISGGYESVRVVEDTGTKIALQHLLVVGNADNPFVVKHWRQDWEYEPAQVLVYEAPGKWVLEDVPEEMRKGRWSQTVYQVDDSPRYAGWGQWETTNGVRQWTSNWTIRPLARRDATRNPVYDHYRAINRHQNYPGGWVHWQDNTKLKWVDGEAVPYVQESVLNTYERFDDYPVSAADNYWTASADYWAAVRAEWDVVFAKHGGVSIEQDPGMGTSIAGEILNMGTQLLMGGIKEADAIARAKELIREGAAAGAASTPALAAVEAEDAGY
ncbi:MAG: DUF6607 family protein [Pseudomonadota bacterium]